MGPLALDRPGPAGAATSIDACTTAGNTSAVVGQ
jgi:hypothetical protein